MGKACFKVGMACRKGFSANSSPLVVARGVLLVSRWSRNTGLWSVCCVFAFPFISIRGAFALLKIRIQGVHSVPHVY